jgi:hypothetical protein
MILPPAGGFFSFVKQYKQSKVSMKENSFQTILWHWALQVFFM